MGLFSSNANTRSIAFGTTGEIRVTGNNATIWSTSLSASISYTGTSKVVATYAGAVGTRTLQVAEAGGSAANALNIFINGGTDTVNISAGAINNLDYTGFSGTMGTGTILMYGNLTLGAGSTALATASSLSFLSTSGTQLINSNGVVLDRPISFGTGAVGGTFSLQSNLTTGFTRTVTFNCGSLVLNNNTLTTGIFSAANSNVRSIAFENTGKINVIANNATVFALSPATNFSYTGNSYVELSYAGAAGTRSFTSGTSNESQALNFYVSAGTDTVNTSGVQRSLDLTGFSGTLGNIPRTVFGGLTISATTTVAAGTNTTTFAATSGTQQITTNGKTLDFPLTFDGIGGTFAFQDALTQGSTRNFTITNGTVQLKNGVTSTVGNFVTSGTNQKFLQSTTPGSQATISQASGTVTASYLTISDSFATGGADWEAFYANNNVDAGNNSNWDFGATPILGTEYTYTLRSFTQPRRF
jgi:fibronectin-binding autotransporter adhesin